MDDPDDQSEDRAPKAEPLSKASSWMTLGFLFGAATVWAYLSHQEKPVSSAPPTLSEWPVKKQLDRAPLTRIEAVFATYKDLAVWDKNTTEVAMWREGTRDESEWEWYEVRRVGEDFYFRSILHPSKNRLLITHGKPLGNEVPLRFTETEAQYQEWFEHGRFEKSEEASLQPTILGPAMVPAGETLPRPKGQKQKVSPPADPAPPLIDRPKGEIRPQSNLNE